MDSLDDNLRGFRSAYLDYFDDDDDDDESEPPSQESLSEEERRIAEAFVQCVEAAAIVRAAAEAARSGRRAADCYTSMIGCRAIAIDDRIAKTVARLEA